MRIAVIAANGRLGKVFVELALASGHDVRAGVRGVSDFAPHPNLEVIHCDATSLSDLRILLEGQEVVVSALGHIKGSPADVQTAATNAVIEVMNELNIKRFVDVTGTGIRFNGDKVTIADRFLNLAVTIIDPTRVKDGQDHIKALEASSLDWTAIRVLKLQNVKARTFELRLHGPTKLYVGRREVALAMLLVIEAKSFIKQAPIVSSK